MVDRGRCLDGQLDALPDLHPHPTPSLHQHLLVIPHPSYSCSVRVSKSLAFRLTYTCSSAVTSETVTDVRSDDEDDGDDEPEKDEKED